jgi:hypothetical protein
MANMQRNELLKANVAPWLILLVRKLVNRKRRYPVVTALRGIQEQEHATVHRSVGIRLECTEAGMGGWMNYEQFGAPLPFVLAQHADTSLEYRQRVKDNPAFTCAALALETRPRSIETPPYVQSCVWVSRRNRSGGLGRCRVGNGLREIEFLSTSILGRNHEHTSQMVSQRFMVGSAR